MHLKSNGIPLRDIVGKLQNLGYADAHFIPNNGRDKDDLRDVLDAELTKYSSKFLLAMLV